MSGSSAVLARDRTAQFVSWANEHATWDPQTGTRTAGLQARQIPRIHTAALARRHRRDHQRTRKGQVDTMSQVALDDGGNTGGGKTNAAPHGVIADLPENEYHARPELSSTGARLLLDSPARFKYRMGHPFHSDAFDLGTAVHSKVLGVGHPVTVLDFADFRSKAAQTARDEAREAGRVPILASVARVVDAMAEAVLAHPKARELFEYDGTPEASVFSTDAATGVRMRARFDYLATSQDTAVDLKTTAGSASAEGFRKSAATYGYHIQEAHYLDTLRFATQDTFTRMLFVVVEKDAPYFVAVHQLDEQFALIGQDEARRAREIYAQCLDTNQWPAYPTDIIQTSPPSWLVYQHQEQYEQEIEVAL